MKYLENENMLICGPKPEEPWNVIILKNHYDNFLIAKGKGNWKKKSFFFLFRDLKNN
jgi:hypothetical protein